MKINVSFLFSFYKEVKKVKPTLALTSLKFSNPPLGQTPFSWIFKKKLPFSLYICRWGVDETMTALEKYDTCFYVVGGRFCKSFISGRETLPPPNFEIFPIFPNILTFQVWSRAREKSANKSVIEFWIL